MITINSKTATVKHGGNIEDAVKRYGSPRDQWLDLSTGISPWSYPVENLPKQVWNQLPPPNTELIAAAAKYYGVRTEHVTAIPGSQIAIRLIPQLFKPAKVAIPSLGYQEHIASWRMANHQITTYHNTNELLELVLNKHVEHVVIINPNNPSGEMLTIQTIEKIASQLTGSLIIDEAFIDTYDMTTGVHSATSDIHKNMIVLRSVGKFFGLAGIRLGFAIGFHQKLSLLNALLEPWSLSHVSQYIGTQALQDTQWQQQQAARISQQQSTFQSILKPFLNLYLTQYELKNAALFNTVLAPKEELLELHHKLATQSIWTRLGNQGDDPSWLRFGLPCKPSQFKKRIENI